MKVLRSLLQFKFKRLWAPTLVAIACFGMLAPAPSYADSDDGNSTLITYLQNQLESLVERIQVALEGSSWRERLERMAAMIKARLAPLIQAHDDVRPPVRPATPELSANAAGAAVLLALGGVMVLTGRRQRAEAR